MYRQPAGFQLILFIAILTILLFGCSDKSANPTEQLLTATPSLLAFETWAGLNPNPAQQKVLVALDGRTDMLWSGYVTGDWLRLGPTSTDTAFVTVISANLQSGTYHDTVFIESENADNSPLALPVTLQINNRLVSSVDSLVFTGRAGGSPPDSQIFEIVDHAGIGANYQAVTGADWLSLAGATGTAPGSVTVTIDQAGLGSGRYVDSIVLTSVDLPGARTVLPCYLNLSSWSSLDLPSASVNLEAVQFVDPNIGWISGWLPSSANEPHGLVYRTINDGQSWIKVQDRLNARFGGLAALDAATCWVVGDSAVVIYTLDSGATWQLVSNLPIASTVNLRSVAFAGHRYGWVLGRNGVILHTADSGSTWVTQASNTGFDLNDLSILNNSTGWIAGNHGTILHTTNGGANWNPVTIGTISDVQAICFVDATYGWIALSSGSILRTFDGGASWNMIDTGVDIFLTDIFFADQLRGWVVGLDGTILFSDDSGLNWLRQPTERNVSLSAIFFLNETLGWTVGNAGTVLKTASGGF